ncbi:hypothetical protein GCM10009692_18640 [Leucobacter aridicollis]
MIGEARARLNADLQRVYGVCLTDMYEGRIPVLDVADFAVHLPRGGAVHRWVGGWAALTAQEEHLVNVEHLLNAQIAQTAGKRSAPPFPDAPKGERDAEVAKARAEEKRASRARALASMQNRING